MTSRTVPFYAKDCGRFILSAVESRKEKYLGLERRMESRRQGRDRRIDVRFNLTKSDRRALVGRRADDALPTFW